ncbi:MAG: 8-oxo-dGTP diphosphatase [Candidatus Pacearchaeota archaeon]|nr:8-oxo-dGTP diphosphatase [Candidatus Pacearchaeota archaeon]
MTRTETVGIICKGDFVLLGLKKKRFGKGKYNGFGGGVEKNEIYEEAITREVKEESGINVIFPEHMGKIFYEFDGGEQDHIIHFFKITDYKGIPKESDEMIPKWFYKNNLPYEKMWEDSKYWLPMLLEDKKFYGEVSYDENHKIKKYFLNEIKMNIVCSKWL